MGTQKQKTIVVTGGAGFIGFHLCERLFKKGHKVISLDNYFVGTTDNHVLGVEYRKGDTKDIAKHITETPDAIYHLGEYARVEVSLEEPARVWDFNIAGTFGVLEFWRACGCKLIYAGSSTKFGDGGMGRSQSPYAWSKASNTELIQNYGRWYALPYAVTYFYNVYGPRERSGTYGSLIEIFRKKYHAGEPLPIVAPGTQKRNFTHVFDIVEGLLLVGEKGEGNDFGIGHTREYTIRDVAEIFGGETCMLPERRGNRMEAELITKKTEALGWSAKRELFDYIAEVKKQNT